MKHSISIVTSFLLSLLLLSSCSVVPISGRNRLNLVSDDEILAMSFSQYRSFMARAPLSQSAHQRQRVEVIGSRIARATDTFLRSSGMVADANRYRWEFNVVASNQVNAFCMPGGKIVVYEGLLNVARTDDEVAAVVAHEVAHAIAKHANERMSQKMLSQYGVAAATAAIGGGRGTQQITQIALQMAGTVFFELPYSRKHEYEADRVGLYLMALAGYDYTQAASFWRRMSQREGSANDVLSTHPAHSKRIQAIEQELPAVRLFVANGGHVSPKLLEEARKRSTKPTTKAKQDSAHPGLITHY